MVTDHASMPPMRFLTFPNPFSYRNSTARWLLPPLWQWTTISPAGSSSVYRFGRSRREINVPPRLAVSYSCRSRTSISVTFSPLSSLSLSCRTVIWSDSMSYVRSMGGSVRNPRLNFLTYWKRGGWTGRSAVTISTNSFLDFAANDGLNLLSNPMVELGFGLIALPHDDPEKWV